MDEKESLHQLHNELIKRSFFEAGWEAVIGQRRSDKGESPNEAYERIFKETKGETNVL